MLRRCASVSVSVSVSVIVCRGLEAGRVPLVGVKVVRISLVAAPVAQSVRAVVL